MFVRLLFAQHFKDSFDIASSSVHEDGAVFGAVKRVEEAVDVLLMRYPHVKVVPIITTCSTEVIGDDIDGVVRKLNKGLLKEKYADREVHLIPIHTPSFKGSHGEWVRCRSGGFRKAFAKKDNTQRKTQPDYRMGQSGGCNSAQAPSVGNGGGCDRLFEIESFDSPLMPDKSGVSHGSTTVEDLIGTANALGTIALNKYEGGKAAEFLESEFDVPAIIGPTPIGIRNTDTFLQNLKKITGKPIPESLVRERGIAIDALTDLTHMFFADKRVAIYGNPDLVIGLAEFCLDLEMKPVILLLGDDNQTYTERSTYQGVSGKSRFRYADHHECGSVGTGKPDQKQGS